MPIQYDTSPIGFPFAVSYWLSDTFHTFRVLLSEDLEESLNHGSVRRHISSILVIDWLLCERNWPMRRRQGGRIPEIFYSARQSVGTLSPCNHLLGESTLSQGRQFIWLVPGHFHKLGFTVFGGLPNPNRFVKMTKPPLEMVWHG